jgi:predicted transcriptional regulator
MLCIRGDGTLTLLAKMILGPLKRGITSLEEIAKATDQSLPRIRSGLRELKEVGYVKETEGKYELSEKGEKALQ